MIQSFFAEQASEKLNDQSFQQAWKNIYEKDLTATVFQHPTYITNWYRLYPQYQPLILLVKSEKEIQEILFLAILENEIVGAGHHQAEYQTTLSRTENKISFLADCIRHLLRIFPDKKLSLKYLPQSLNPLELENQKDIQSNIFLKEYSEPVIRLDSELIKSELNKKNRREKLNRLKKIGNLTFQRITDSKIFRQYLDQLAIDYDFRQGAMFGSEFFSEDQHKKEFMLNLFDSGLLYVTLLFSDQTIIAANASTYDKGITYLQGFNTHHPVFAKYSPGILSFLMSALQMQQDGLLEFDLTPGSVDDYKGDLATDFYRTWSLEAGNKTDIFKQKLKSTVKSSLKKLSENNSIQRLKVQLEKVLQIGGKKLNAKTDNPASEPFSKFYEFSISPSIAENSERFDSSELLPDNLKNLLQYKPDIGQPARQNFLFDAMKRMEFGQHVYTRSVNNKLSGYAWFVPAGAKLIFPTGEKTEKNYCFFQLLDMNHKDFFNDFLIKTIDLLAGTLKTGDSLWIRMSDESKKTFPDLKKRFAR